jgi:chromate transporter
MDWHLLWQIFWVFTKVAMFSWGGGPASLGLMQRESVAAGWVSETEFADAMAIGNALPGPIAIKVPTYVGYKLAGIPGAISGMAGSALPAFLLMLVVVVFFFSVKDNPKVKSMLTAVRPLIVGLLLWTAYDVAIKVFNVDKVGWAKGLAQNWSQALIVVASFVILAFTSISPVWLVIATAILGLIIYRK